MDVFRETEHYIDVPRIQQPRPTSKDAAKNFIKEKKNGDQAPRQNKQEKTDYHYPQSLLLKKINFLNYSKGIS